MGCDKRVSVYLLYLLLLSLVVFGIRSDDVPDLLLGHAKWIAITLKAHVGAEIGNGTFGFSSSGFGIAFTVHIFGPGRLRTTRCLFLSLDPLPLHKHGA